MYLKDARCTGCSANVKVNQGQDTAVCGYCGATFVVEKAINNYTIANAQISTKTVNVSIDSSDFVIEGNVLVKYRGNNSDIIIPENVKEIGKGAFKDTWVEKITVPESIIKISWCAFGDCKKLTYLILPPNIKGSPLYEALGPIDVSMDRIANDDSYCYTLANSLFGFPINNLSKTNEYRPNWEISADASRALNNISIWQKGRGSNLYINGIDIMPTLLKAKNKQEIAIGSAKEDQNIATIVKVSAFIIGIIMIIIGIKYDNFNLIVIGVIISGGIIFHAGMSL